MFDQLSLPIALGESHRSAESDALFASCAAGTAVESEAIES
jgi:hypothetical protein